MNIKNKIINIVLNIIPILVMIWLITIIQNDYLLTVVYIGIILISFFIKKEKGDIFIFIFGFFTMIISEMIFISTGVETFVRNTLFGLMPLWLPFLWGYGFVVIKRGLKILE
jgi:cell division protein FtsW (lipid II flippase)